MIITSRYASNKLLGVVKHNLRTHRGYGSPPIFYWYRNVIEAIKLIDNGNVVKEGEYKQPLEKSLGDVFYYVRYANNEPIYIIYDFQFNTSAIRLYTNRARLSSIGVNLSSRPLFTSPSYKPLRSVNIGYGIICSEYQDGSIWLSYKGTSLNTQFDRMLKKFCIWKDGIYAIFERDGVKYKLFSNGTTQMVNENFRRTIRLTETQFMEIVTECITKIIKETSDVSKKEFKFKQLGNYTTIDGEWMIMPHKGLEMFDRVQDVRMYDNNLFKGTNKYETIVLFRDVDSMKYFYAKIIPIKGLKEIKWQPLHKEEVPRIILDDLKTINPQGHEPFLHAQHKKGA